MTAQERQRLEAVLPFYVNGRADEHDRAFVEGLLADDEVAAMLAWHQGLADKVRLQVESVDDHIGLAGLMRKVHAQRRSGSQVTHGWRAWLSLDRWLPQTLQVPAFAVLACMVVGQSVLLYQGGEKSPADDGYSDVRGAAPSGSPSLTPGDVLKVNFKDDASEHDLRMLLISAGATIIQGPGQLGDYLLHVPAERAEAAAQELRMSQWVNSVQRVKPSTP